MTGSAGNAIKVLESLYRQPITTVNRVRDLLGVSYAAANNLVARFVEVGILTETTGNSRNRRFVYQAYLDLFGSL